MKAPLLMAKKIVDEMFEFLSGKQLHNYKGYVSPGSAQEVTVLALPHHVHF